MKAQILALGLCTFLTVSLPSATLKAADTGSTPAGESLGNGIDKVKEGTKEAAKSINAAAEQVTKDTADLTQKVGRSIKAATCPVVGDRKTKLYYAADSKSYAQVLDGQKYFEDDDRSCFHTEDAARAEGIHGLRTKLYALGSEPWLS